MSTPPSSQEQFTAPVYNFSLEGGDFQVSLASQGTAPSPASNAVIFQGPDVEIAVTAGGEDPLQAVVAVNESGRWVTLDRTMKDLQRLGRFFQQNRSQVTTFFKVIGSMVGVAGADDAGNYILQGTALSDMAHNLHSAIDLLKRGDSNWLMVRDMGRFLAQAAGLAAGIYGVAAKADPDAARWAAAVTTAAAVVGTGKTGMEERKDNLQKMGLHPGVDVEGVRGETGQSVPLQYRGSGSTDLSPVSSGVATGITTPGISRGSTFITGTPPGILRGDTFNRHLEPMPEVPESAANPIPSSFNPGDPDSLINAPRVGGSRTFPQSDDVTTRASVRSQNHTGPHTNRRAK
ncbi:hypothetical protein ACFZDK_52245 [Streptomyces sp. NPDC007901]|uniref:hypothetical protein n=1 Tax=Streptomyces sp. NPDC007901 TaxID=3364785 RepID=UPI0036EBE83B